MINLIFQLILFAVGLSFLIKGANWLVSGASSLAIRLQISPIVIGLTVVSFGTSSPELLVSLTSALSGSTEIALSNVIGSNIANILLVLGASALIYPLILHKNTVWKEIPMSFLGAIILAILALRGSIGAVDGLILISFFVIFLYYTFVISRVGVLDQIKIPKKRLPVSLFLALLGLIVLTLGSKMVVFSGVAIAHLAGVSETFVGLTLIALGTSLPELSTSLVAAFRKEIDIAVGNVVGSNIFNIFLVLGVTSIAKPLPILSHNLTDIAVLFASTILLFILLFVMKKHTLGKIEGSLMLISYFIYLIFLILREG